MHCYLAALVALLVPLAYGYEANQAYPTFAPCDQKIVSSIKTYWLLRGRPRNVLQDIEKNGRYTIVHTSYDYLNSDNKCIFMNSTKGFMDFAFPSKTKNETAVLEWKVEVEDGIISGKPIENDAPEHRWKWYTIYNGNGILVCYVCSDRQGSLEPPLLDIMVADTHKTVVPQSTINTFHNLLGGWGIRFRYKYGPECF